MNSTSQPNWVQQRWAIRGYKRRLAGRLRREYGVQDTYLPQQVEFCARHEFAVRRFGVVDWFAPQFLGYAFALFCDKAAVQAAYPGAYPDTTWENFQHAVQGVETEKHDTLPIVSASGFPAGEHSGFDGSFTDSASGADHD